VDCHVEEVHELIADGVELVDCVPHAAVGGRADDDPAQGLVSDQLATLVVAGELVDGLKEPWREVCDGGEYLREVG